MMKKIQPPNAFITEDSFMRFLKKYFEQLYEQGFEQNKNELLNLLEENRDAKILDIGCSDGSFTKRVANRVKSTTVFGIEIIKARASEARKNGVNAVVANADRTFPFKHSVFDFVISNNVIEHVCDTDLFIKEIYRVLRRGGVCFISTPNIANLQDIISLMLGYQPFSMHVSDEIVVGNPLNPSYKLIWDYPRKLHRRLFTARALKELFEFHGFECEKCIGRVVYPLPISISKLIPQTIARKYSEYIIIKAIKM